MGPNYLFDTAFASIEYAIVFEIPSLLLIEKEPGRWTIRELGAEHRKEHQL